MAIYCYTVPGGITVEREFERGEAPPTVVIDDGVVAERDFRAEHTPRPAGAGYPFDCYAIGVHPSQRDELHAHLKSKGCGDTQISRDGDPQIRDRHHYRRVLEAMEVHPRNSFTSR